MRSTVLSLLAVLALVAGGSALAGSGASRHAAILSSLDVERAANGIPGRVRENPGWSAKCAKHVTYMRVTGILAHSEDPASPAYTADGDWAGQHSVLAKGSSRQDGNPFADAPIHLIQLMSPELRQVGVDSDPSGYLCVTTWPGYDPSGWRKPTVYSDPGNGAVRVPFAETADELPFVPGDFVGLPHGTPTGFNIMVFAEGTRDPWHLRITAATLTGPGGPVALRTLDRMTPTIGAYLPPGSGFLIPVAPLRPGATYTASVNFGRGEAKRTWHFTTAAAH